MTTTEKHPCETLHTPTLLGPYLAKEEIRQRYQNSCTLCSVFAYRVDDGLAGEAYSVTVTKHTDQRFTVTSAQMVKLPRPLYRTCDDFRWTKPVTTTHKTERAAERAARKVLEGFRAW